MKTLLTIAAVFTLSLPCIAGADDKAGLKPLQGEWKFVSGKRRGEEATGDRALKKLLVKDNHFTLVTQKRNEETDVAVRPDKKPMQIDFVDKSGRVTSHGIYKIEGKKLTFCFTRSRDERPKKFESPKGSRLFLLVFERAAEKKKK